MKSIAKNKYFFSGLLLLIILLGSLLRLVFLSTVPPGFNQDEASIGYNAYSILKTGKDEYGRPYPIYFKAFGDQKLPVYIYATAVSEVIFGVNEFAVRFPSAIFGILCLPLIYLLVANLSKKKWLALLMTFLVAINPWSLHYNRSAFEVSISLFLFLAGTLFLYYAFAKRLRGGLVIGTIFFLLSLYSYNLTRLLSPLLFLFVYLWFNRKYKGIARVEIGSTIVAIAIFLLPFFASFFSSSGVDSASGTLIFSSARFQAPLLEFRTYLISFPSVVTKLFFNMQVLVLWEYLKNIYSYFSVPFLFLVGEDHGNHGIGNVGEFYLFEFPLMLVGLWQVIKQKDITGYFFLIWGALTILVASLTREAPQATRSFFLIVSYEYLSALGLFFLIKKWSLQPRKNQVVLAIICAAFFFYNLLYYFSSYYYRFPTYYAKAWRSEDKDVTLFIKNNPAYKKIIFDTDAGFSYASFLFYDLYDPTNFQRTVQRLPDDSEGFSVVTSFGNISFAKLNESDTFPPHTLIITNADKKLQNINLVKTLYYPERTIVSADGQHFVQYPYKEVAYELFEAK